MILRPAVHHFANRFSVFHHPRRAGPRFDRPSDRFELFAFQSGGALDVDARHRENQIANLALGVFALGDLVKQRTKEIAQPL